MITDEFNSYNFGKPHSEPVGSWWLGQSRESFREVATERNKTLRRLYGHTPIASPPTDTEQRYMNKVGAR